MGGERGKMWAGGGVGREGVKCGQGGGKIWAGRGVKCGRGEG